MQRILAILMQFLRIVFFLCIFLMIFLLGFRIAFYDDGYYQKQFEMNRVYEVFGKEKVDAANAELRAYLNEDGPLQTSFFNDREKQHLVDVQGMVGTALNGFYLALFLFLATLVYFFITKQHDFLSRAFLWAGLCGLVVISVLFFMTLIDFNWLFAMFHVLGFKNDLWLLNPVDSNLIQLFPLSFFYGMFVRVLLYAAVFSLLVIVIGLYLKKYALYEIIRSRQWGRLFFNQNI